MTKSADQKKEQGSGGEARNAAAQNVFVIGIGASAGSLHALETLFSNVPQDGVAYVVVQHISSEHRNLLTGLVAQYSALQVQEAQHEMPVEHNKIYITPNNKEIIIRNNRLLLTDKTLAGRSKTVDVFLKSLAADKGPRAAGLILSGTGTYGSEGIRAIKHAGGLVLTLQDITERKQYEQALKQQQEEIRQSAERFRTMLEAVPHITWTSKPNGENISFNKSWYETTGLSEEDSIGWGWKKAIHPADLEELMPDYQESLEAGKTHSTQARILRLLDGQYRWHLIKVVPLRYESGDIMLWIGTATDIQDQKDAEEANIKLQLSQQREIMDAVLQTQEEERNRISEALHNGLGQVLYAAKLNLDNLKPESDSEKMVKENVDQLLTQGIKITRDISTELTPTVLNEFGLTVAVEEIISRFTSPQLKIKCSIKGFEEKIDYAASLALYRIIQELLNNVVRHSGATLASVELTKKGSDVLLRVKDNGNGITCDGSDTMKGIGLSSIKSRLKLLNGKMEVQSTEGKGAEFIVQFHL